MPLDYKEFSAKIKSKYPEYSDVDDLTLAQKVIEKYPEYKDKVVFEPVKKKRRYGITFRSLFFGIEWQKS